MMKSGRLDMVLSNADLNRDRRPEIIVGYVNAPGVILATVGRM